MKLASKSTALLLAGALAVGLVGCGSTETASTGGNTPAAAVKQVAPKDAMIAGHKELEAVDSFHFTGDMKMKMQADATADAETQAMAKMYESFNMTMSGASDNKAQKIEYTTKTSMDILGQKMEMNLPALVDVKAKKLWMGLEGMSFLAGEEAAQMKGKYMEMDFAAMGDVYNRPDVAVTQNMMTNLDAKSFVVEELSAADKAKGAKQKISVTLDEKLANEMYRDYLAKAGNSTGMQGLQMPVTGGKLTSLLGDNNRVLVDDIVFRLKIETIELTFSAHMEYTKFGEKVTFTIHPSPENIIPMDQLPQ